MNYEKHFPYKEIRPSQKEAIEFALESLVNNKKRFVLIEAGTGVGKSAVGYTVAQTVLDKLRSPKEGDGISPGSYYVTTQKILQDQYIRDFGDRGMCSIKSSSNYSCTYKHLE